MYKIFVKGNYFYIERLSDGRIFEGHKKNVLVSSLTETSDDFYFWNINGAVNQENKLNVSVLVDELSVPFTVATFRAFIEDNTGNFNSGVPAALNGPYNRLINYFADDYTDLTTNIALTPVDGEVAIVRNAQGTSWLPYNLGGTYYPKGGYIYDGANWIPQTDLITQQLEINVDDINNLETTTTNHIADLANPHSVTKTQVGLSNVPNVDTTTTANITDSLNKRFVTDANIATIGNQSGTNTGDETTSSIQTKRPLKTIEGQSLEGAGNIDLQKSDVGLGNVDNTSDANKPVSIATQNALDLKVDKVTGKDLSDENYTLAEKNKLAGIEAGAEVNPNATEIKSLYESNANTNAFTDAEKTLLSNQSGVNTGDETTASIQTKRPLKTVNSISLEGAGNIPFPVFGQDASCIGINTPVSTNSTTGYASNNLVIVAGSYNYSGINALQVGADYIVFFKWNYSTNSTNASAKFRLYHNGTAITNVIERELKDTTDDITITIFARFTATGNDTIELRFASENAAMTVTVSITDCFIFRIA